MKWKITVIVFLIFSIFVSFGFSQERDALKTYKEGNYEEAVEICRAELEVMPQRMDAYVVMCWSLIKLNRYEEALEGCTEGIPNISYGLSNNRDTR